MYFNKQDHGCKTNIQAGFIKFVDFNVLHDAFQKTWRQGKHQASTSCYTHFCKHCVPTFLLTMEQALFLTQHTLLKKIHRQKETMEASQNLFAKAQLEKRH